MEEGAAALARESNTDTTHSKAASLGPIWRNCPASASGSILARLGWTLLFQVGSGKTFGSRPWPAPQPGDAACLAVPCDAHAHERSLRGLRPLSKLPQAGVAQLRVPPAVRRES